jgi:hypothetical protein
MLTAGGVEDGEVNGGSAGQTDGLRDSEHPLTAAWNAPLDSGYRRRTPTHNAYMAATRRIGTSHR